MGKNPENNVNIQSRAENEELTQKLENQGIVFNRVPNDVYPGMPYTTPDELADNKATLYSHRHINRLIDKGQVSAIRFGNKHLLTPEGVETLLRLQEERLSTEQPSSARTPGPRNRKPRLKRNRASN